MLVILAPLLIAIVGALAYALADGKVSELGRIAFFAGMLALALAVATKTLQLP
jgi:Na+/phosphate symporter